MSEQTATNRFIVSPSQAVLAGLYQHLFSRAASFQELGNRLVRYAEHAQAIRQVEQVREAGQLLANLPLKEYQAIGQYYLAWCDYRNNVDTREGLEYVAEYAPMIYRARALQSLAAIEARKQDYASELRWLVESMKVHPTAEALRGIAIVKAKEGYHRSAVKAFESLHKLAQYSGPINYLQYLNSYAVELGEVGRKEEARNVITHVVASPFAPAYPEWRDTHAELSLKRKNHSSVTVTCLPKQQPKPKQSKRKDNVINFPMVGKPPMRDEKEFSIPLSPLQTLGMILKSVLGDRITYEEVDNICANYYKVIMEWYS